MRRVGPPREDTMLYVEQLAQGFPPEGTGGFYERLARWFLADPTKRPPNPF
jgi:hypothetical protein